MRNRIITTILTGLVVVIGLGALLSHALPPVAGGVLGFSGVAGAGLFSGLTVGMVAVPSFPDNMTEEEIIFALANNQGMDPARRARLLTRLNEIIRSYIAEFRKAYGVDRENIRHRFSLFVRDSNNPQHILSELISFLERAGDDIVDVYNILKVIEAAACYVHHGKDFDPKPVVSAMLTALQKISQKAQNSKV